MRFLIFLILSFSPFISLTQTTDSFKKEFLEKSKIKDTNTYVLAEKIITFYYYSNPDSAIKYSNIAIKVARLNKDVVKESQFMILKSDILAVKMDYYNAIDLYFESLQKLEEQNKNMLYAKTLLKLARVLLDVDFENTDEYLFQARDIFKQKNNIEGVILSSLRISEHYSKKANFDSALIYVNTALELCEKLEYNQQLKAKTYYYYSKIYISKNEYLKAITFLKKSLSILQDTDENTLYLKTLADIYVKLESYDAAYNLYNSAFKSYEKQDNIVKKSEIYIDLARLYLLQNNTDSAVKFCQQSLKISKKLNLLYQKQDAYYTLSLIYSEDKKIDLALHSYKKYSDLRDSLFTIKTKNEAALLYKNYIMQLKLKDKQIIYNQKEYQVLKNKQQQLAIYILTIFGFILIILIFILLRMYFLRKNSEQRLKQLTEVTLEGLIIHDGHLILEVNDKYCETTGFEREEIIGENIFKIMPKKSQKKVREKLDMKRTVFYQMNLLKKNEEEFYAEILSKPIVFKGIKAKIVSIRDLSEISKIKEKLHETTEKFEALIEKSPDGIVLTDFEGNITYVSPAFIELFGDKTIEEFIGNKLHELFIPLYRNKIITDIKNILYGDYCGVTEYVALNTYDEEIYLECNGDVLKDIDNKVSGIFMIVRDITERKISENALIESESRFKGLFNTSKDAIIIQNMSMKIVDANPTASEFFQYSYDQLISLDFRELLPPENRKIVLEDYVDKPDMLESFAFTKSRKKIYVQISVSKLVYEKSNFYLLTIRDMTTIKRQEDNLRRIANKLQASNATKDKMFSIISHDLRGPMGNLKAMIEFIAENPSEFDTAELVEIISSLKESSNQTYELLENLLSWAKSQQNLLEFRPDIYDLNDIILSSVNFANGIAKSKQIEIVTKLEDYVEVVGDLNMIRAILRNLISNAIKFSNPNSNVVVFYNTSPEIVTIGVEDNGVGISEENLKTLFDETSYVTTYGTNKEKGSGLGLKLCKEFVKKNNGKIWVESNNYQGTTFYFTLKKAI